MEDNSRVIEVNGRKLTVEEFEIEKKRLIEQNMKLVEVASNVYKTRLED